MRSVGRRTRTPRPEIGLAPGEQLLAWAAAEDGRVLAGSHDAVHIVGATPEDAVRIPWEQVEAASWQGSTGTFRISEVGTWGDERVEHELALADAGRLPELVRERVTASIVLQRHVPVAEGRGLRVIARRAPRGEAEIFWVYEYDEGVDPADPEVARAARTALAQARQDVGLG